MSLPDLQQKFIEDLAALEHEQWMTWAKSIMETEEISQTRRKRWEKFMIPYSDLPEEVKEHDRTWAVKVFELCKRHIDD